MRCVKSMLGIFVFVCCSASVFAQMMPQPPAKTSGDALNSVLNIAKGEFVSAADAMPEDKYSFAPTNGEFKGVRTFAEQVKHVAAVNYIFGASILQEKPPVDTGEEKGPATVKSKAEIMKFLNDSFEYLHKALDSINDKNQLDQVTVFGEMKMARLSVGAFACAHPMDHYGQMVEYLRMNGIVPPASRPQNK
jgi:uncharacterized damage-inducible protein DinB